MRVAVIGSNGQLGSDLVAVYQRDHEVVGLTHSDIEITDIDNVKKVLDEIKPGLILNTAAYHNVPLCEQNKDLAFSINGTGAQNLALVSNDLGAKFIHYSTDYVFDGARQQPYTEEDRCNPLNIYAITKLSGEHMALNYGDRSFVVRISGIYGKVPCRAKGGNFITTMLRLAKEKPEVKVVNDEFLTPTPTSAIAENTLSLSDTDAYGVYHMTCSGEVSWYEFARTIWDVMKLSTPLYSSSAKDFPLTVKRPFYSVLDNANLRKHGIDLMPHWKEALTKFLLSL